MQTSAVSSAEMKDQKSSKTMRGWSFIPEGVLALETTGRILTYDSKAVKYGNPDPQVAMPSSKYWSDTGTEPSWMIEGKFKRYLRRCDYERFNVLFVVLDEKRTKAFARRAEKFLDKANPSTLKFFLFTTPDEIIDDSLGAICHIAYDTAKLPIIPNLLK